MTQSLIQDARLLRDDTTNALVVTDSTAGSSADVASTLTGGRKTVTTAGTALAIRASLACKWVTVTALTSNSQVVVAGGSAVLAAAGSEAGIVLSPGSSVTVPVANASTVFVDSRVNGEGVTFLVGS